MPINKNEITKEMIKKAMECKTAEELMALAKAEGVEITKEEAKAYLEELADYELDEDQIERIAGGHHKNRDGMCEAALRGLKDISWGRLN